VASGEKTKKVVLVAEDDEANAKLLRYALGAEFEVRMASNGREALELAQHLPLPDVVVLDVMMPRMDGLDVATRLQHDSRFKRAPIIFLSAKDHPMDVTAGIQRGARYYITKPFKISELLDKVRRAAKVG
jgi:DNA-binding response OmpR family regulator